MLFTIWISVFPARKRKLWINRRCCRFIFLPPISFTKIVINKFLYFIITYIWRQHTAWCNEIEWEITIILNVFGRGWLIWIQVTSKCISLHHVDILSRPGSFCWLFSLHFVYWEWSASDALLCDSIWVEMWNEAMAKFCWSQPYVVMSVKSNVEHRRVPSSTKHLTHS